MLEYKLLADRGVHVAHPKAPLSPTDFAGLSADPDAYIKAHGALNGLMICAEKFPGWDSVDGFLAHFRFVRQHHRKIRKVAFVSDSDMLVVLQKLASYFVNAEVRHFRRAVRRCPRMDKRLTAGAAGLRLDSAGASE
jgi:hypothetical protein